jgi:hypothetical protein
MEEGMDKAGAKHRRLLAWIGPLGVFSSEFPTTMLAIGIIANFAWLVFLLWILSYWIAWR